MKYTSTLGGVSGFSFRQALFSPGFMKDGGLLLPETIPNIKKDTMEKWSKLTYPEIICEVSKIFINEEEIPHDDLKLLIDRAMSTFSNKDILTVQEMKNGVKILEMFHGKTWVFKDLAMSCLGQMLQYFMKKDRKRVIAVVSTSGDTGSAVIEALRGLELIDCIVMLPRGRCTQIQERQMTTVLDDNIHVYRVDGSSDDIDVPVKDCFMDVSFAKKHELMTMNSINWGRVMIQIAHYFFAYFKTCEKIGDTVEIIVPTGAMGNVTAGLIAYKMGLNVRFVSVVTPNDVIDVMLKTGDVIIKDDVIDCYATAMMISNPYNIQRLYRMFCDDVERIKEFLDELHSFKKAQIPYDVLQKIRHVMTSYQGDDNVIKQTIKRCYDENDYVICPHTALAMAYCYEKIDAGDDKVRRICLATASPQKFPEAVASSGVLLTPNDDVIDLMKKPTKYVDMEKEEDWRQILREKIEQITASHKK